jgi:3-deoxy-D-manno-octulosonic-acid transferase
MAMTERMMRWVYDFGFLIFGIFSLPHFLGRLTQAADPARLVRERFGFIAPEKIYFLRQKACLWIHSVSVGEVLAVEKLIKLFLARRPGLHIVLTTVTPTGQRMAERWAGERVSVLYFPLDFQFAVSRFFEILRPLALLLVETEIWPNVIQEARRRKVPIGIVNGRVSERSFRAFRRFSPVFKPSLTHLDFFLVQTEKDRERLVDLGVDPSRVTVTGNMKLDAFDLNGQAKTDRDAGREKWGYLTSDRVVIACSTHAGVEEIRAGADGVVYARVPGLSR